MVSTRSGRWHDERFEFGTMDWKIRCQRTGLSREGFDAGDGLGRPVLIFPPLAGRNSPLKPAICP